MRLGILGGSFDPIHFGHLNIAAKSLISLNLDKVIFAPLNIPWSKKTASVVPARHRVNMIEIAIKSNNKFEISMADIERGGVSYSIDLVNDINNSFDSIKDIYLIIGDDNISSLIEWKNYDLLNKQVKFVVASRQKKISNNNKNFYYLNNNKLLVSSTKIKENIRTNNSISDMVPKEVINYIKINNIYL
tara:strand:+ start:352 stop:918 length:567 start_codon:yes stop_codon:yes gene_type:complete